MVYLDLQNIQSLEKKIYIIKSNQLWTVLNKMNDTLIVVKNGKFPKREP